MHVLIVTTQNAQTLEPMIEHRFYGRTPADAHARYNMHLQADQFFRACGTHTQLPGDFHGTPCISSARWERV